jgi:spore photoproduct lyase
MISRTWKKIRSALTIQPEVNLQRLTLGGICIHQNARRLMEKKLGSKNIVSANIDEAKGEDGRARYGVDLRVKLYAQAIRVARAVKPDLEIALCLEEPAVWKALKLEAARGRCNCVL